MKTTVEIPDILLEQARQVAAREGSTVRALVEEGLRAVLDRRKNQDRAFQLRKVSVSGEGLHQGLGSDSWTTIRGMIYDGHGE